MTNHYLGLVTSSRAECHWQRKTLMVGGNWSYLEELGEDHVAGPQSVARTVEGGRPFSASEGPICRSNGSHWQV